MVSGRRSHAAALWHSGSAMPGHPRSFRAALSGDTRASRPSRNAALRSRRSLSQALGPCHRLPACRTRNVRRFPPISARRRKSTPRNTHSIAYSPRNCKREWRRGKTRKNDRIRISSQNRRKTSRKGIRRKGPSPYILCLKGRATIREGTGNDVKRQRSDGQIADSHQSEDMPPSRQPQSFDWPCRAQAPVPLARPGIV